MLDLVASNSQSLEQRLCGWFQEFAKISDQPTTLEKQRACEAILTEAATKGHLEHVRESVEALQFTVRIRPTFGISPPKPSDIFSVTQTRVRPD